MTRSLSTIAILLVLVFCVSCAGRIKEVTERDKAASLNYYRLAYDFYRNRDVVQAIKSLREAEKFDPNDVNVNNLYGLIYLGKKMFKESEASFKKAVAAKEDFSDGYVGLSAVYMAQERWQDAVDVLQKPSADILYYRKDVVFDNMGWCYHMLGKEQEAITSLKSALMENPSNCHVYYNLGLVYKDMGQYPESIMSLKRGLKKCPTFFYGYYELALIAIKARDNATAKDALDKCVELGSNSVEAEECAKYLRLMK